MSMKRRSILGAGAAAATLAVPLARAQSDFTLRIGAAHPTPALPYVLTHDTYFVPEVVRRAKDKNINVRFVKAWAGTVAKVDGMVEATQKGVLDLGLAAPAFEASKIGILNWGNVMAFGSTNHRMQTEVANRIIREVKGVQDVFRTFNTEVLALHVSENYGHPLTRDLSRPEDLKGRKLSIAPISAHWLTSMGAIPVPMSISEAYTSLQNGMIEGNTYFISGMTALKLSEVAKFYYKAEQGVAPNIALLMNLDTRKKLPKELNDIIDAVAIETSLKTAEINAQRDRDSEAAVQGKVKIIQITEADKRRWAEAMKDHPSRIARELDAKGQPGSAVFKAYVRYMAEAGHKWPYEYPL